MLIEAQLVINGNSPLSEWGSVGGLDRHRNEPSVDPPHFGQLLLILLNLCHGFICHLWTVEELRAAAP